MQGKVLMAMWMQSLGSLVHAMFHFNVEGTAGRVIIIIIFVVFLFLAVEVNANALGAN